LIVDPLQGIHYSPPDYPTILEPLYGKKYARCRAP